MYLRSELNTHVGVLGFWGTTALDRTLGALSKVTALALEQRRLHYGEPPLDLQQVPAPLKLPKGRAAKEERLVRILEDLADKALAVTTMDMWKEEGCQPEERPGAVRLQVSGAVVCVMAAAAVPYERLSTKVQAVLVWALRRVPPEYFHVANIKEVLAFQSNMVGLWNKMLLRYRKALPVLQIAKAPVARLAAQLSSEFEADPWVVKAERQGGVDFFQQYFSSSTFLYDRVSTGSRAVHTAQQRQLLRAVAAAWLRGLGGSGLVRIVNESAWPLAEWEDQRAQQRRSENEFDKDVRLASGKVALRRVMEAALGRDHKGAKQAEGLRPVALLASPEAMMAFSDTSEEALRQYSLSVLEFRLRSLQLADLTTGEAHPDWRSEQTRHALAWMPEARSRSWSRPRESHGRQ